MIDRNELEKQMHYFIICLHETRYFDAHEALELIWFPLRKTPVSEVNLLRGYINAAVSFELHKRGRKQAAERVWGTFKKYQGLLRELPFEHQVLYKSVEREIVKIRNDIILI